MIGFFFIIPRFHCLPTTSTAFLFSSSFEFFDQQLEQSPNLIFQIMPAIRSSEGKGKGKQVGC
jgi:hypothetical protein